MSKVEKRSLSEMKSIINEVIELTEPTLNKFDLVGSIRRNKELIGDVDILTIVNDNDKLTEIISKNFEVISGLNGHWQVIFDYKGIRFNLLKSNEDSYGASLLHSTGSQEFNMKLRAKAKWKGFKLNQWGLFNRLTDEYICGKSEMDIFNKLGLSYVSPEDR